MKAIISTNYDPKYVFFMPIVAWAWNKLGVGVHFVIPSPFINGGNALFEFVRRNTFVGKEKWQTSLSIFNAPSDNHEVTYTQVSRLFAAADTQIPDDEILITSDCDMAVFGGFIYDQDGRFTVHGADLVPQNQYPMCYISATASAWRNTFVKGRTLQQCLDDALAAENCTNMRSNLWARDQELLWNGISPTNPILINRAHPGTQFATKRYDRDDAYILDRLSLDAVDFHMNRPGYEQGNFEIILKIFQYHYPLENLDWMVEYRNSFVSLL